MKDLLETLGGQTYLEQAIGAKNFEQSNKTTTFRFQKSKLANTLDLVTRDDGTVLAVFSIVPSRPGRQPVKVLEQEIRLSDLKTLFEKTTGLLIKREGVE